MKLVLFTTISVLILVFILPAVLALGIRHIPSSSQPPLTYTQKIYGDLIIYQPFTVIENKLSLLGMSIKNPNLINKKDLNLNILNENGEILRSVVLSGKNIEDGGFLKFKFKPIENSKNRKLIFALSAPASSETEALEVFLTNDKILGVDSMTINSNTLDSAVAFVSFYERPNIIYPIAMIYSAWINNLLGDSAFFLSYIILMVILTVSLIIKFRIKSN